MAKDIKVSQPGRWGCPKKVKGLPAFLLPKEEREKLRYRKSHLTGRLRKTAS